jgi:hypothetical protein
MLLPLLAAAQGTQPVRPGTVGVLPSPNVTTVSGVFTVLCQVLGWFFILFIILAVVFVIVAAFKYLTAGGDAEKVGTANHMLIYAVVAVVVAVIARAIPVIIANFFSAGGNTFAC